MSDRQHEDLVGSETIHDLEGESVDQKASILRVGLSNRTDLGLLLDALDCRADGIEEFGSEATTSGFVPAHRLDELLDRGLAYAGLALHRPRIAFSMRFLTSSQGSNLSWP